KLCLTYDELVPEVMSKSTYDQNKSRKNITVHGVGGNGRKVLIEFDSLPQKYKHAVRKLYGDPYEYCAKQPILDLIDWDWQAQKFYQDYVLPNGAKLPDTDTDAKGKPQINYVHRYTEAATWLNTLVRLTDDKRALKRELNVSVMAFWDIAAEMIDIKKVSLPTNTRRLKDKVKSYK